MRSIFVGLIAIIAACGGSNGGGGDGDPDAAAVCTEGTTQCTGNSFQTCEGGEWVVDQQCPALCDNDLGCIACQPDQRYCDGDTVLQCNGAGTGGSTVETCSGGAHCLNGGCVDLCVDAAENDSYIGCEYYAVDLDNAIEVGVENDPLFGCLLNPFGNAVAKSMPVCYDADHQTRTVAGLCDPDNACPSGYTCETRNVCVLDAAHSPFAVVVSNPQSFTANVTISNATGTTQSVQVPAGQVIALTPQSMGFADQSVDRSMQGKVSYRVVSDVPVVAYQFNPLDNANVFSNDASLLIPTTTWNTDYYVMSWPTLTRRTQPNASTNDYNSYLTVVASVDDTVVEVTPRAATRAQGAIGAITAGTPTTFTLDAYEVLNLEAVADGDLSGSLVRSMDAAKPIGVFGGHEAIVVAQNPAPNPQYSQGPCCADHIEEMMFPTSTWGKEFAIARSQPRNSDNDHLRVMAQTAGTTVTFTPAPASGTCATLGPGEFCEVEIAADTAISSNEPILVGQYLESVIWSNGLESMGSGDPSLAIAVPVEQFRQSYTILVPMQYEANYLGIATTATGTVAIDGNDVTSQLAAFAGDYRAARIMVTAGQHTIACSAGCGVEVMGYSGAVSYLFAGGLDLRTIVVD